MVERIKEPFEQLPMFPCYLTDKGEHFLTLQDAAKALGKVTYRPEHFLIRRPGNEAMELYKERSKEFQNDSFSRETFFKEIYAVQPKPHKKIEELYKTIPVWQPCSSQELADKLLCSLVYFLEANWDSTKLHIMPHSSGYDSRLLSGILRHLQRKNGDKWFGEMRFFCWQPEIEYTRKIVDYLNWPREWFVPFKGNGKPEDYYARILDFDFVGRNYCEAERFWEGPGLFKLYLDESGIDPTNTHGVSALFSDETKKWNRKKWFDVGYFMGCWFFDNPSPCFTPEIKFLFPFVSFEYVRLLSDYWLPETIDEVKLRMLKLLDPELANLNELPNYRFVLGPTLKKQGYHEYQKLSAETRGKMEQRFTDSWYCKTFHLENQLPLPEYAKYYDDKVTHYIKAAIFDHLIKEGVEICQ